MSESSSSSSRSFNSSRLYKFLATKQNLHLLASSLVCLISKILLAFSNSIQFTKTKNYLSFVYLLNITMASFFFALFVFCRFVWNKFGYSHVESQRPTIPANHNIQFGDSVSRKERDLFNPGFEDDQENSVGVSGSPRVSDLIRGKEKGNKRVRSLLGDDRKQLDQRDLESDQSQSIVSGSRKDKDDRRALLNKKPSIPLPVHILRSHEDKPLRYWAVFFFVLAILASARYILEECGLSFLGTNRTTNLLNIFWTDLVFQGVIPVVVGFSYFLSQSFSRVKIFGSGLVLAGGVLSLLGYMLPSSNSGVFSISGNAAVGPVVLFLSNIPFILSQTLKARAFQTTTITYLNMGFAELVFAIPAIFLASLPLFIAQNQSPMDWINNYSAASSCMSGYNLSQGDDCQHVWIVVLCSSFCYFLLVLSTYEILNSGSITLLFLIYAISFPLENMLLSIPIPQIDLSLIHI
eukprot:TRINITY_DN7186_c0_g1_i1.p1 TRINITY_DN7186_c0_g1~~TRINITY_DN7186_c0_g1_i1.p1  ORF type:complete len:464 (-),score=20.64 TRINITY_DN7186_c0_g1_i1:22-1413(-)